MANANLTPMPFVRKFGSTSTTSFTSDRSSPNLKEEDSGKKLSLAALAQTAFPSRYDPNAFVDISGATISAPAVTGACKRCGYPGHLYFQCRNHIEIRPNVSTKAYEVSSTSSESSDDDTPLIALEKERKKEKKLKKKERKERKKAKKLQKKERRERDVMKKRRRDYSDESSDTDGEKKKKKKKSKINKKEKRKRDYSSDNSSDSDDIRSNSKRHRKS